LFNHAFVWHNLYTTTTLILFNLEMVQVSRRPQLERVYYCKSPTAGILCDGSSWRV